MGKRPAIPALSADGAAAMADYAGHLAAACTICAMTARNYLSDLRHFAAWVEACGNGGAAFAPAGLTEPLLLRYRAYLQAEMGLQPASINRALISIKRYCAWAVAAGRLERDPAAGVKLLRQPACAPRQISEAEEAALVAAVDAAGSPRDYALVILMLRAGVRVGEVGQLRRQDVALEPHAGALRVAGPRNKVREVPLDAMARAALAAYERTRAAASEWLFPSEKTGQALTERAIGYLIAKYAGLAGLDDICPHDLRHRFGYRMAAQVPPDRLAQMMGHDSPDTTMAYFTDH